MKNSKDRKVLIICAVFAIGIPLGYAFYNNKYKSHKEDLENDACYFINALKEQQLHDSLFKIRLDSIHRADSLDKLRNPKKNEISNKHVNTNHVDCDEECYETEVTSSKRHRGTSPDDGMFGFDYYDDPDDEYHMERNQTDPYPNEKDW